MNQYLFCFGFLEPGQTDGSSSEIIFISAETEADAKRWGAQVADQYLMKMYGTKPSNWEEVSSGGGHIEKNASIFHPEAIAKAPRVVDSEMPIIDEWLKNRWAFQKARQEEFQLSQSRMKLSFWQRLIRLFP